MVKKASISIDSLPEVFVSNKGMTSTVSKAVKAGRLRKIGSRLYTRNMTEAPDKIVKRNWYGLLKDYFPDALISDRTALESRGLDLRQRCGRLRSRNRNLIPGAPRSLAGNRGWRRAIQAGPTFADRRRGLTIEEFLSRPAARWRQ